MSDKQINGYAIERTTPQAGDFLDVDADLGGGTYQSQKLKYSNLLGNILANATNVYKNDGDLTGNRDLNFNGYEWFLSGGNSPRLLGFGETSPDVAGSANYTGLPFNALVPRQFVEKFVKKVTASNWTEYQEGITTLQSFGGGVLELLADITVTTLVTLNHSNIVVKGNGYKIYFTTQRIRISGNAFFENVNFYGGQLDGANPTTNTLCFELASTFVTIFIESCRFVGVIGQTVNDDPVILHTGSICTTFFNGCRVSGTTDERSNFGDRKLVCKSNFGAFYFQVTNHNDVIVMPTLTIDGKPAPYTNYFKVISPDGTTWQTDGTALVDSDDLSKVYTRSNNSGGFKDFGSTSGSLNINMIEGYDTYKFVSTGNITLNIDPLYLAKNREVTIIADTTGGHSISISGVTYEGQIPTGSNSKVFNIKCLNDISKSGNPSGVPNVIIY